jgi:hypothetical protein
MISEADDVQSARPVGVPIPEVAVQLIVLSTTCIVVSEIHRMRMLSGT